MDEELGVTINHGGTGMNTRQAEGSEHSSLPSFFSRLLGLHNQERTAPLEGLQAPLWVSAFKSMKLSDIFQGVTFSANVWWLFLFLAFIFWLFVVYWIRQHEPTINKMLGNKVGHSQIATYDQQIVDSIKDALPAVTSFNTTTNQTSVSSQAASFAQLPGQAYAGTQASHSSQYSPFPVALPSTTNLQYANNLSPSISPSTSLANESASPSNSLDTSGQAVVGTAYCVEEQSLTGTRLKTIVNR